MNLINIKYFAGNSPLVFMSDNQLFNYAAPPVTNCPIQERAGWVASNSMATQIIREWWNITTSGGEDNAAMFNLHCNYDNTICLKH